MPLPDDEKLLALGQDLIKQLDLAFGQNAGFRPAHAKGLLLQGVFSPDPAAASLTRAPHMNRSSTPVTVRFSNSTGLPLIPDNDPNADPRGCAVRFHLAEHTHTDFVGHSVDGFPTRTGQEFLELLRAVAGGQAPEFLARHPAALAFAQTPKPTPTSFARESYFGVTAMRLINTNNASRFGRFRIVPEAGNEHLAAEALAGKSATFLFDELTERVKKSAIRFHVQVQLAELGDVVDDATIHWPAERSVVTLGEIVLGELTPDNDDAQRHIIFDPIPRVDGLEPSSDPLLELRAAIYLMSGRRRRAASEIGKKAATS